MHRYFMLIWLAPALLILGFGAERAPGAPDTLFADAASRFVHAVTASDEAAMDAARSAVERHAASGDHAAEANYLLAAGDFYLVLEGVLLGEPLGPDESAERFEDMIRRIEQAPEDAPDAPARRAFHAAALCASANLNACSKPDERRDEAAAVIDALDPGEHPDLDTRVWLALYGVMVNASDAPATLQAQFAEHLARLADAPTPAQRLVSTLAVLVHVRATQLSGDVILAAADATAALECDADVEALRVLGARLDAMAGALGDGLEPIDPGSLEGLAWRVAATDAEGDGQTPGVHDARELAVAADGALVWFRIALHNEVSREAFGVNIVIGDDSEGSTAWWGTNSGFHFTRLVTLWLAESTDTPGRYAGSVGLADVAGVQKGDFGSLAREGLQFALLPEGDAIAIGVPASWFGEAGETARVIGAVGTNRMWNDDIPNEGSAEFTIQAR